MSNDGRNRHSFSEGAATHTAPAPKVGHHTLTAQWQAAVVQRKMLAQQSPPSPSLPTFSASVQRWPLDVGDDPFALHLAGAAVQRKASGDTGDVDRSATRELAAIDAPAADSIEESRGTPPLPGESLGGALAAQCPLSPAKRARARRHNAREHRRLRFDPSAFGGAAVDSDQFALAVAQFEVAHGLQVDGIAGPDACTTAGCLPAPSAGSPPSGSSAPAPAGADTSEGAFDRGATREAATIDAPAADSIEESRSTLAIQSRAAAPRELSDADTRAAAAAGVTGPGGALPHAERIKQSFGPSHTATLDGISAHVGGPAADASAAIGASAYATGSSIGFASSPDLHTAAHEAAHVVQQQQGVHLEGGIGAVGDLYEQHADAVADAVVQGRSAADLLAGSPGGASSSEIQRKEDPAAIALEHREGSAEKTAWKVIQRAALHSEASLEQAQAGVVAADAACLEVAPYARDATDALEGLATSRLSSAFLVTEARRLEGEAALASLDLLVAASLRLLDLAAKQGPRPGSPPAVGKPTLAALVSTMMAVASGLGSAPPTSLAQADETAASHEACPTGSMMAGKRGCVLHDLDREKYRRIVGDQLGAAGQAFFAECAKEREQLDAAIKKDAKWAEIVTDVLIGALVVAGAGALGGGAAGAEGAAVGAEGGAAWGEAAASAVSHAAEHTGAGEIAKHGGHGLEILAESLKETAATSLAQVAGAGQRAEHTDPRAGTASMIDSLGEEVVDTLKAFGESRLAELNDDALSDLSIELSGDLEPFRRAARTFIAKYRQQVEPIGTMAYDDPRMAIAGGLLAIREAVGTTAVWIVGAGPTPRLAIVKEVGVTTENTMMGELPPFVDVEEYDFVAWVDPQFMAEVATHARASVTADQVTNLAMAAAVPGTAP